MGVLPRRVLLVVILVAALASGGIVAWRLIHPGTSRKLVVAASGGAVQFGTRARVDIAPGGLDRDTAVTIGQVTDLPPRSHQNMFVPSRGYDVDAGDARIVKPMRLTIGYDESEIPAGIREEDVDVAVWGEGQWGELPGQVDAEANTVSVEIRHLTLYAWVTAVLAPQHHRTEHFDVMYWTDGPWALRPHVRAAGGCVRQHGGEGGTGGGGGPLQTEGDWLQIP